MQPTIFPTQTCRHRHEAGNNGELFHCQQPRLVVPAALVTAETCAACRWREAPAKREPAGRKAAAERFVPVAMQIPAGPRAVYRCDVVIPYYKNLQWVPAAIDSILWQQAVEPVLHLVNDCSPEEDEWLKRKYAGQSNVLWYRNRENLGPYRSVHQVWRFMRTEFFAVQDSDDVAYPNRLWYSIHSLEESGAEIFGGVLEQFVEPSPADRGERDHKFAARFPYWHSGQKWPGGCPHGILINGTVVMRRRLLERMNGYHDLPCGGDVEFCTRIHYADVRRVVSAAVVGARRVSNQSLSRGGKFQVGQPERNALHERLWQLYAQYERPDFDPARYGCLHEADASLTERWQAGPRGGRWRRSSRTTTRSRGRCPPQRAPLCVPTSSHRGLPLPSALF